MSRKAVIAHASRVDDAMAHALRAAMRHGHDAFAPSFAAHLRDHGYAETRELGRMCPQTFFVTDAATAVVGDVVVGGVVDVVGVVTHDTAVGAVAKDVPLAKIPDAVRACMRVVTI